MPVLPVFLSSTFSDFQMERDVLTGPVCERLNEVLLPLECRVEMIDLRWGVDTTSVGTKDAYRLVLEICLDEVERARPLFLGLVGGRYGDVPDPAQTKWVTERAGIVDSESLTGLSVSAIEMGYGCLWEDAPIGGQVFLLRDLKGEREERWVDHDPAPVTNLRSSIMSAENKGRCTVAQYETYLINGEVDLTTVNTAGVVRNFEDVAYELLLPAVMHRAEELSNRGASERTNSLGLFQQDRQIVAGRGKIMKSLVNKLQGGCKVLLEGESGVGKSTLLLAVGSQVCHEGIPCATFVSGLRSTDYNEVSAIRVLASQINKFLREPALVPKEEERPQGLLKWWQSFLETAVQEIGHLVLLVDGLERIPQIKGSKSTFLSVIPPNVSVLVTSASPGDSRWLGSLGFEFVSLEPLSQPAVREALESWARVSGGRTLPSSTLSILSSGERLPIWVRMAVDWLAGLGADEFSQVDPQMNPGEAIANLLETESSKLPNDATDLAASLLARTAARVGESTSEILLAWLSASRSGLLPADLAAMLSRFGGHTNGSELAVARMRRALGSQLVVVDQAGRIAFSHSLVKNAASRYVTQETHRQIAEHLINFSLLDEVSCLDAIWHLLMCFRADQSNTPKRTFQLAQVLRNSSPSEELGNVILSAMSINPASVQMFDELRANDLGLDGLKALNSIGFIETSPSFEPQRVVLGEIIAHLAEEIVGLSEPTPQAERVQKALMEMLTKGIDESCDSIKVESEFIHGNMVNALSVAHYENGYSALSCGDTENALWHFERGLSVIERGYAGEPLLAADLSIDFHLGAGRAHEEENDLDAAGESYENAVSLGLLMIETLQHESSKRELSVSLDSLARVKELQGLPREAKPLYEDGLKLIEELRDKNGGTISLERDYAVSLDNLARVSWKMGNVDVARRRYVEAFEVTQRLAEWQPNDVEPQLDLVDAYRNLATFENSEGLVDAAISHLESAVKTIHLWTFRNPSLQLYASYGSLLLELADLRDSRGEGRFLLDILARALKMYERASELTTDDKIRLQQARASLRVATHLSKFRVGALSPEPYFVQAFQISMEVLKKHSDWDEAKLLVVDVLNNYLKECEVHPQKQLTLLFVCRGILTTMLVNDWPVHVLRSLLEVDERILEYRDLLGSESSSIEAEASKIEEALGSYEQQLGLS